MNWNELLTAIGADDKEIIVTVINPVRKGFDIDDNVYKKGKLTGFKTGVIGGGHSSWKGGMPQRFDSSKLRFIKKPKVHVTYEIFTYGKREHSDWIDVDNCEFEIKEKKK